MATINGPALLSKKRRQIQLKSAGIETCGLKLLKEIPVRIIKVCVYRAHHRASRRMHRALNEVAELRMQIRFGPHRYEEISFCHQENDAPKSAYRSSCHTLSF